MSELNHAHPCPARYRHNCVSTIFLAAAGALGGYLLGHTFALRQAEARLDQFANRILLESVTSTAESRAILATMNTSPYDFCSDAEIEYFRQLIFQSQFLKAAGRMRDGRIECSTTSGRSDLAEIAIHARHRPAGWNENLQEPSPVSRRRPGCDLGADGDSFIVYNPYNLTSLEAPPMHFTATAVDAPTHQAGQMLGETPNVQQSILMQEGKAQVGDTALRHALLYRRRNLHDRLYLDSRCVGDHPRLLRWRSSRWVRFQELSSDCCSPCSTAATRAWSSNCFARFAPTLSPWCISPSSILPQVISSRPKPWCAGPTNTRMRSVPTSS